MISDHFDMSIERAPSVTQTVEQLAEELFALVEYDQGKGFVSDGLAALKTHDEFWKVVKIATAATDRASAKLHSFLKKYHQEV
jgi:hypothetical protein